MKTLHFEVTITLTDASELSEDDVYGLVSDGIGYVFDDADAVDDYDVIDLNGTPQVNRLIS